MSWMVLFFALAAINAVIPNPDKGEGAECSTNNNNDKCLVDFDKSHGDGKHYTMLSNQYGQSCRRKVKVIDPAELPVWGTEKKMVSRSAIRFID